MRREDCFFHQSLFDFPEHLLVRVRYVEADENLFAAPLRQTHGHGRRRQRRGVSHQFDGCRRFLVAGLHGHRQFSERRITLHCDPDDQAVVHLDNLVAHLFVENFPAELVNINGSHYFKKMMIDGPVNNYKKIFFIKLFSCGKVLHCS